MRVLEAVCSVKSNDIEGLFISIAHQAILVEADSFLERLRSTGAQRNAAVEELRVLLLRGLSQSLNNRYGKAFSAEDIVQDALIRILGSLDQYRGQSSFITWAITIANRVGISALRRKYHSDTSLEAFEQDQGIRLEIPQVVSPDEQHACERQEVLVALQRLIDTELTEKQRLVIRAFLADFSTDDIAERLGTNRNAIYKLIHDARIKLKIGFENAGISTEDIQTLFK